MRTAEAGPIPAAIASLDSAAGLRALRFHALRHGAGSLVARETDARWVQGFLRHSKITTTERYLQGAP